MTATAYLVVQINIMTGGIIRAFVTADPRIETLHPAYRYCMVETLKSDSFASAARELVKWCKANALACYDVMGDEHRSLEYAR